LRFLRDDLPFGPTLPLSGRQEAWGGAA